MPLISYTCICKLSFSKYVKSAKEALTKVKCKCGLEAQKSFGTTSSSYKVTIDNGLMARSIEVDPNITEINDERSSVDRTEED